MYKPLFNKVLVEIDDKDAKWGTNEENLGGVVYREGVFMDIGLLIDTNDYPVGAHAIENQLKYFELFKDKHIMWHEGHEAGTVFEDNGKKYALIFWWDVIGVKE